jgi:toxin ParE1/3/4
MNLEVLPLAKQDIANAAAYYRIQRAGLDEDFLAEIRAAESAILSAPRQYEEARSGIRRYLLDRFPYGIYYRMLDADTIHIIVVKHHSRRPGLGMRRT